MLTRELTVLVNIHYELVHITLLGMYESAHIAARSTDIPETRPDDRQTKLRIAQKRIYFSHFIIAYIPRPRRTKWKPK